MSKVARIFSKLKIVLYLLVLLLVAPFLLYVEMPVINPWFFGVPVNILFISIAVSVLELRVIKKEVSLVSKLAFGIAGLTMLYLLVGSVMTWGGFRAGSYRELLGEVKEGKDFSTDVAPIAADKIRIVDKDVAHRLGEKVLGDKVMGDNAAALGSQVTIGRFRIQKVKNQLYWVAPLLHSGFFKWLRNTEGTPAYIMVSATNERDVRIVPQVNGEEVRIKYQPNAFFGANLQRHLYFSGYFTMGLTDYTFEIDDEGRAYWVVTLYRHDVGFSGENAYGIAVVDAATGEIKEYTADNAPAWIDRIQPLEMVQAQLDDWGEYIHGFWNFANEGKLTTTRGMSLVYGQDNESYWYTGLTSVGRDQATVGFVLVNTRTKEARWYKQTGATEEAAMRSAMGQVQEKGYLSSFPIMYNINGVATYVMSLKDKEGLIKMIAMVSVEDYSIVGVGDNLKEALRAYKDAYNSADDANIFSGSSSKGYELSGRVSRIDKDVTNGNTYYYFTLDSVDNKIFLGSSGISSELVLTKLSDSVTIVYDDARTALVDIVDFENHFLKAEQSKTQEWSK